MLSFLFDVQGHMTFVLGVPRSAIDHMTAQHEAAIRELKKAAASGPSQDMLEELERELARKGEELREKEEELRESRREADDANNRLVRLPLV